MGLPSWKKLAQNALNSLQEKGWLDFSELKQLEDLEPKKQLSIAKLIANENKHELDLAQYFRGKVEGNSIYKSINDIGCTCVTTNYDELLAPRFYERTNDQSISIKPREIIRVSNKSGFIAKHLDEPGTVIHLHGVISQPDTMVISTREYLEHYDHKHVQHFLRELFTKKTVLFLGYGLEEAEILEHILRRGSAEESIKNRRRFALQGFFVNEEPLYKKLHQYDEKTFGVHLIGFVRDLKDYAQQESIINDWAQQIQVRKPSLDNTIVRIDEVLGNDTTIFSPDDEDLLEIIDDKEELRSYFFRKAKGLKWFSLLAARGYFKPEHNPLPKPAKEEGYIDVPFWSALEYLVVTSIELRFEKNNDYAEKFIELIRSVTNYAITHDFSNFRTWWQFSKIIQNIPPKLIQEKDIALVDYWLNDPYERGLIVEQIGVKWLAALLESNDDHCKKLAVKLLDIIYKLEFRQSEHEFGNEKEVWLRFRHWDAKKVTEKIAGKAGRNLGLEAVKIFQDRLESILVKLNNDNWTSVWRPAIEDHEQNHSVSDTKDIILEAFRDSLLAYIGASPAASRTYVEELLKSPFKTIGRIALYAIDQQFQYPNAYVDHINIDHFNDNFRHELWHLLKNHYREFRPEQKSRVLEIIKNLAIIDETGQKEDGSTAYQQLIWLSAIKDYGDDITQLYRRCLEIVGGEPELSDFSNYMTYGRVDHKSSFNEEVLLSLSVDDLVKQLEAYRESYKPSIKFNEPSLEGLSMTLRQAVKAKPLHFHNQLHKFCHSDLSFIHELIEAYRELWSEKVQLPWDEIWGSLLDFCQDIVKQDRFWVTENAEERGSFVANRH